ncbi:carboxylating nicotinate-nucleotide diphosphorylase [Lishizhenia sp.]|uniref:carboxylating nicotinate-nucleotide diphosphorylase n=1 Tax=Lishizhenia sp. TaxID=2497594 RepID=UPI00299DC6A4|nr:carboxylating nicotinate-nucleotide diphosphorylase [Lishizhenia sp.]MDX1445302.1 carboxylating nicotinate-nucleotide diphosphorylase [Lishizhenia sp.]
MIDEIIDFALREDLQDGDHSSLSTIPESATGIAKLLVKDHGIAAGVELAERIFHRFDPNLKVEVFIHDGEAIKEGDIILTVEGSSRSILSTERLVLNFMQRMSGIATHTNKIVQILDGCDTKLLDTRKTTPCIRAMEKWAVKIGGGYNHRFGLYDMIMIKDNHIDYAGGIAQAIKGAKDYLQQTGKDLKIEVEVRDTKELEEVLAVGGIDRIMLDNFTPEEIKAILPTIPEQYETEASGGITIDNIRAYGETGVDYISSGALTHSISSLDLSLKATFNK